VLHTNEHITGHFKREF